MDKYKITYRTAMKLMPGGGILRNESNGTIYLKSPEGVKRFCQELSPFVSIKILDNKVDATKDFASDFEIIPSRYLAIRNNEN